jgi:hypothetical protein
VGPVGFLRVGYGPEIKVEKIFQGSLVFLEPLEPTKKLVTWAEKCLLNEFGESLSLANGNDETLNDFIRRAQATKTTFTNHEYTKQLLEEILLIRYSNYLGHKLYYDVPRLRIIPNSKLLSSGISYNYLPHRDTWYGARQDQINHWLSVRNVSDRATFFISPSYFGRKVENTSENFDLDTWDKVSRPAATLSVRTEIRPHPKPLTDVPEDARVGFDLKTGHEVCFSGHHLHGSNENISDEVRVSIDYRISIPSLGLIPPANIDNKANGKYLDYMFEHPMFADKYSQ